MEKWYFASFCDVSIGNDLKTDTNTSGKPAPNQRAKKTMLVNKMAKGFLKSVKRP